LLAREAVRMGGTAPCALNAANEVAVEAFLSGKIPFLTIYRVIESVLEKHTPLSASLDNILGTDAETRRLARTVVEA
jgi:1-deoxy-D-xylulose-5-phosphate reductoisomerase